MNNLDNAVTVETDRYNQTLVDLIKESAIKSNQTLDEGNSINPYDNAMMAFLGKVIPHDLESLIRIANQINEQLGIDISKEINIKKLAKSLSDDNNYISRTYNMSRYNNMKRYERKTIDKIIEAVEQSRDDKIKMFIDHIIKCIQEHQASSMQTIVYDVMVRRRMDDDKKDIMLFIQHNQLSRLRGKVLHNLEDIEDIVDNSTITATNVDEDFKAMFENTREVKSECWESATSYYHFKKPYTKQELKTLLRKIYNDNKNH